MAVSVLHVHQKKIAHLDLKMENWLVDAFGNLLLIDFNGAFYREFNALNFSASSLTKESFALFSIIYQSFKDKPPSPEEITSVTACLQKVDTVALGAIFYTILTNNRFTREDFTPQGLAIQWIDKTPMPPFFQNLLRDMIFLDAPSLEKILDIHPEEYSSDDFLSFKKASSQIALENSVMTIETVIKRIETYIKENYEEKILSYLNDNHYDRENYFLYKRIELL